MSKRTNLFVLIGAGILVVGLGTGLIASYALGGLQVIIGSDGPEELAYLPADASVVAFANVREVMDSELRQKIGHLQPGGGSEQLLRETGIDIERDIDHVTAAMTGSDAGPSNPPLVIARGRFDTVRIEGLVRQHGGAVEEYQGRRLVIHGDSNTGIAFLEPGLVGMGSSAGLRRAIDTKAGNVPDIRTNGEVMRQVRDVDDGNAWAVARFETLAGGGRLPQDLAIQLPSIQWFSIGGRVNGGFRGTVRAEARDETAAQDLRDVIRGFVALARMQAGSHAGMADIMNSFELGGQGSTVWLAFSVPVSVLDGFIGLAMPVVPARDAFGSRRGRPSPPGPAGVRGARPSQPNVARPGVGGPSL